MGAQAEKEATDAADKNHSRIEEARIIAVGMPEVPDALPAPKSLGGLLDHIVDEEEPQESGFEALTERAEELTDEIEERQNIVSELLAEEVDTEDVDAEEEEAEPEV